MYDLHELITIKVLFDADRMAQIEADTDKDLNYIALEDSIIKKTQEYIDREIEEGSVTDLSTNSDDFASRKYENDLVLKFLDNHKYWSTEHFEYTHDIHLDDDGEDLYTIRSKDPITDLTLFDGRSDLVEYSTVLKSVCKKAGIENIPSIKICDVCGAPMESGYTNGELFIHSYAEFYYYMNSLYPYGWFSDVDGSYVYNTCDGLVEDTGWRYMYHF